MANTPNTNLKWHQLNLIPTTDLVTWYQYESGVSANGTMNDYSSNGRHLSGGATPPTLQANVVNGQPAWYFNGTTTTPLKTASAAAIGFKHAFIIASHEGAAFNEYRGLIGGQSTNDMLLSNNSGTTFFDLGSLGLGAADYYKSGVAYADNNAQAPMSRFELLEFVASGGASVDGIQIGLQKAIAGRIWKGWVADVLFYNAVQTGAALRRIQLYYAMRYGAHRVTGSAIPFYFPSKDLVADATAVVHARFKDEPRDWSEVTAEITYADGGKDFNEFGTDAARRWNYRYTNVSKAQKALFDVFADTARIANAFKFKDADGYVWENVRIDNGGYIREHDEHKRWNQTVEFNLVGYNSTATFEG